MLTSQDLGQIKQVVTETIQSETPKIVRDIIRSETPQIVENIITKHLKPIKKDIHKIRTDLETAVGALYKDRWALEQKFDSHLTKFHTN
jgi:hypothetical protein